MIKKYILKYKICRCFYILMDKSMEVLIGATIVLVRKSVRIGRNQ